jgi:uncharacterized lipoprotein YmbA
MTLKLSAVALAMLAASCSPLGPLPNHNKFFMLSPISQEGVAKTSNSLDQQIAIGVGPIDFPDYLKRPEVVTRTTANRIDVSERDRWAGPLDKNFTHVLSENLATILNTQRILSYPWNRITPVDYQVVVNVEQFDTNGKQATLIARWSIRDGHDGKELYATETTSSAPVGAGEEGASAALSSNTASLSREIAAQLTALGPRPHPAVSQR